MSLPIRHRERRSASLQHSAAPRSVIQAGLVASLLLWSCGDGPDPYTDDVPTKGHVLILADEDLRAVVEAEEFMFESIYTKATLDIRYLPEAELLKAMLNDSVRCTIMTTQPGGEQESYFRTRSLKAHVVPIGTDAIAVIVNKGRLCTAASLAQLQVMLDPRFPEPTWRLFESADDPTHEQVLPLFTSAASGIGRVLVDSLGLGGLRGNAKGSMREVVEAVIADPRHVGVLSFATISDMDDTLVRRLREEVRLLPLSATDDRPPVLPSQSTLADGSYPLRRPVFMVLAEGKSGLGTGFVSFVANHKGQRIILKQGLAPQTVPAREIELVPQ